MKICPICKTSNFDIDTQCKKCSYPLNLKPFEKVVVSTSNTEYGNPVFVVKRKVTELSNAQRVARAFMIFSCVFNILCFLALVSLLKSIDSSLLFEILNISLGALIYFVLMVFTLPRILFSIFITTSYCYRIANEQKVGILFGVATLIFVNRISGILILCDSSK